MAIEIAAQPSGPRLTVGVAVTWNDDLIGSEGGFFPALLHAAIGSP